MVIFHKPITIWDLRCERQTELQSERPDVFIFGILKSNMEKMLEHMAYHCNIKPTYLLETQCSVTIIISHMLKPQK